MLRIQFSWGPKTAERSFRDLILSYIQIQVKYYIYSSSIWYSRSLFWKPSIILSLHQPTKYRQMVKKEKDTKNLFLMLTSKDTRIRTSIKQIHHIIIDHIITTTNFRQLRP
jgi:hypothetical protein